MNALFGATPIFGDLVLEPGERFVGTIGNFAGISSGSGELSLYSDWKNPSDATLASYVHWRRHAFVNYFSEVSRAGRVGLWTNGVESGSESDSDTVNTVPAVDSGLSLINRSTGTDPSHWTVGASTLAVPEPSALAIALFAVMGLFGFGRRGRHRTG